MKKAITKLLTILLFASNLLEACLNTISNNTKHTYKIVEITKENPEIKQAVYLPKECLDEDTPENHTHTILPNEECSFGGHYVPTFAIFKETPDKKWRNILVVKQLRCGPRGPENKYLLITDLLKRDLPSDYRDVYKFTLKVEAEELVDESANAEALTSVTNQYQVILNLIDDLTQKIQEMMSKQLREERQLQPKREEAMDTTEDEESEDEHAGHEHHGHTMKATENKDNVAKGAIAEDAMDTSEDEAACDMCKLPSA